MTEREERVFGIRLAEQHKLPRTVEAVRSSGSCYRRIMQTIAKEAGIEGATALIAEARNPEWAYYFAYNVQGLTEGQNTALIDIVAEAGNPEWAYYFAYSVQGLTEGQNTALFDIVAEANNPMWAYSFARKVRGLSGEQRRTLNAIS